MHRKSFLRVWVESCTPHYFHSHIYQKKRKKDDKDDNDDDDNYDYDNDDNDNNDANDDDDNDDDDNEDEDDDDANDDDDIVDIIEKPFSTEGPENKRQHLDFSPERKTILMGSGCYAYGGGGDRAG